MAVDDQLRSLVDALRATRDADVNYRGLQTFRRLLRRPAVVLPLLAAYTAAYPGWVELSAIWDAQASRSSQDLRITVELLELLAQLLTLPQPPAPATAAGASAAAAAQLASTWSSLQPALDDLADSILARRLKQLYFALGSGVRPKINAALLLLGALASRGAPAAAALVGALDWSLSALTKLARPPRLEAGLDVSAGWASWSATSLGRRPCRALWLEFACELLRCADGLLLPRLFTNRALMTGLLAHLATDPPGVALGVLRLLGQLLTRGQGGGALGPAVAGAPWREAALAALAELVHRGDAAAATAAIPAAAAAAAAVPGLLGTDVMDRGSDGEGSSGEASSDLEAGVDMEDGEEQPAIVGTSASPGADAEDQQLAALVEEAAAAAYHLLLQLVTNPALGLAGSGVTPASPAGEVQLPCQQAPQRQGGTEQGGSRRLLLFLRGLSPGSSPRHLALVHAALGAAPGLAAPLLCCASWGPLEVPRPEEPWQVAMALTAWLVRSAAGSEGSASTDTLQQQAQQAQAVAHACKERLAAAVCLMCAHDGGELGEPNAATPAVFAAVEGALTAARGLAAPPEDSSAARAALAAVLPPGLTRLGLSRGLQHPSDAVVRSTLTVLAACCQAAQQLLEGVRRAAASIDSLAVQLSAALAATGLPHQGQVVHQVWQVAQGWRDLADELCLAMRARLPEPSLLVGLLGALAAGLQRVATSTTAAGHVGRQEGAQEQCLQLLLVVLGGAASLGGGEGAGLDPAKHLVTQGLLQWPPALQAAALRVVATASHPNAGTPPHPVAWTGQQLSVLATLLVQPHHHLPPTLTCQEDQHQEQSQQQQEQQQLVQQLSYQLLCSALARLCCADWEPALWLGCLARLAQCTHPGDAPGSAGSSSLSASLVQFLVEAVAAAGRRPLAAVEVAAAVGGQLAGGSAAHEAVGLQQAASPLALVAVRQALRLAASPRAAPATQAVVAGYVAAAWHLLLAASPHPAALALLLQQVLLTTLSATQPGGGGAEAASSSSSTLEVPAPAAPLVSLWVAAQQRAASWFGTPVATAIGSVAADAGSPPPSKRSKGAQQGPPHSSSSSDWREGVLQRLDSLQLVIAGGISSNGSSDAAAAGTSEGIPAPISSLEAALQASAGWVVGSMNGPRHRPPHSSANTEEHVLTQLLLACLSSRGAGGAAAVCSMAAQLGGPGQGSGKRGNRPGPAAQALAATLLTAAQALPSWPQQQLVQAMNASHLLQALLRQAAGQGTAEQLPLLMQVMTAALTPITVNSSSSSNREATSCLAASQPDVLACTLQAVAQPPLVATGADGHPPPAAAGAKCALLHTLVNTLVEVATTSGGSSSTGNTVSAANASRSRQDRQASGARPLSGVNAALTAGFQVLRVALLAGPCSSKRSSPPPHLDAAAVAAVLQHAGLAAAWLGTCHCRGGNTAQQLVDDAAVAEVEGMCSSCCLSAHLVLLLKWVMANSGAPAPAAAAAGDGISTSCTATEVQQPMRTLVARYVHKAVQLCVSGLASTQGAHVPAATWSMAATAVVQLLPEAGMTQLLQLAEACAGAVTAASSLRAASQTAAGVGQQQQATPGRKRRRHHEDSGPTAAGSTGPLHLGQDMQDLVLHVALTAIQQVASREHYDRQPASSSSSSSSLSRKLAQAAQPLVAYAAGVLVADPGCDAAAAVLSAAAAAAAQGDARLLASCTNSSTVMNTPGVGPPTVSSLFRALLAAPLTPVKVAAAQQLAAAAQQHVPQLVEVLQHQISHHLLPSNMAGDGPVGTAGGQEVGAAAARREVLALLLPVAHTLLSTSLTAAAVAAGGGGGGHDHENGMHDEGTSSRAAAAAALADVYRAPLLAYFSRRRAQSSTAGPLSGSKQEQQLSQAAAGALMSHALPVLRLVLTARPLDPPSLDALLTKLLRPQGLPLPPLGPSAPSEESGVPGDVAAGASPVQQLQLATWLIQGGPQQGGAQTGPAPATRDSSSSSGSGRQLDPHWLVAYAVTATNTLAAVYRAGPPPGAPAGAGPLTAPSAGTTTSSIGSLEAQLVEDLDGWVGDGLAALQDEAKGVAWLGLPQDTPDSSDSSSSSSSDVQVSEHMTWQLLEAGCSAQEAAALAGLRQAFTGLLKAVQGLTLVALKRRLGHPPALRCVRRLLAALAPSGEPPAAAEGGTDQQAARGEEDDSQEVGSPQQPGHSSEEPGSSTSTSTSHKGMDVDPSHHGTDDTSSSSAHDGDTSSISGGTEEVERDRDQHSTSSSSSGAGSTETDSEADADADADMDTDTQRMGTGAVDDGAGLLLEDAPPQQQPGSTPAQGEAGLEEKEEEEAGLQPVVVVVNPTALEVVGGLLQRLTSHSGFVGALMGQEQAPGDVTSRLPPLPPALACLPSPPSSLGPLVEALLFGGGGGHDQRSTCGGVGQPSAAPSTVSSSGEGGGDAVQEAVRLEVVLLLEVLMDLLGSWEAADPGTPSPTSAASSSDAMPSAQQRLAACVELRPLLALLAASYRGSLGEGDRALLRCLLGVDGALQGEEGSSSSNSSSRESDDSEGSGAVPQEYTDDNTAAAAALAGPWAYAAGCLWGPAAPPILAAPAAPQQLQEGVAAALSALSPLRAALTVALFPDRRALPPGQEPGGGGPLHQLYWGTDVSSSSSDREVLPGVPASTAAAAYDPVALLLLGVSGARLGVLSPLVAAGSGLVAVALRSLAVEDVSLRGLGYELLGAVAADLEHAAAAATAPDAEPGAVPATPWAEEDPDTTAQPAAALGAGSARRLSQAERQLSALLSWVRGGVSQPGQQLPAACAVLAADMCLLLTGPAPPAALHNQAARLLLRQPALDTAGLPLLGRLLYGRGGGSSSNKDTGGGTPAAKGSKGGHGHLSPAAAEEGRQWLLHLLWLGLRGPADARIYSRQYVAELLLAATSSPTIEPPSSAAAVSGGRAAMSQDLAHTAVAAAAAGAQATSSWGSGGGAVSFDAWVGALVRQALVLPGAAAHLVAAAGCVPWLGGVAAAAIHATAAPSGPWGGHRRTGSSKPWALQCLTSLLRRGICLRQRAQAAGVFGSYLAAAAAATRAVLEVCTPGMSPGSGLTATCSTQPAWEQLPLEVGAAACSPPPALVPHLMALLDLLLATAQAAATAPGCAAAMEQVLSADTLWRLLCACTAAAGRGGTSAGVQGALHPTEARLVQLLQLLGLDGRSPSTPVLPAGGLVTAAGLVPVPVGAADRTAARLARWAAKMGRGSEGRSAA